MLVKTPVIKLVLNVKETSVADDHLVLNGAASKMPCTIEIGGRELLAITRCLLRPAGIRLMLRAMFRREKD